MRPVTANRMLKNKGWLCRSLCIVIACLPFTIQALTRWSSLHVIPDADFLESWNYTAEYQGYYFSNEIEGTSFANSGMARFGVSEWADFHAGYTDGVTLGLKAKILGENGPYLPSLAIGAWNVLHHREDYYYHHDSALWKNEFFIAIGKSVQPVRLRLHLGIETMPEVPDEMLGYFFGIEKYFGGGVYVSLETFYRDKKIRPSLFTSIRVFKQRVEVSAGIVDIINMFSKGDGDYSASFSAPEPNDRVRPGIWLGFRYLGGLRSAGRYGGFGSIEEQLSYQRDMLRLLKRDVDSLKRVSAGQGELFDSLQKNVTRIADSALGATRGARLREFAIERLIALTTLYGQETFEAEKIKSIMSEIESHGDFMAPILQEIALDNKLDRKIHSQAVAMLGKIGTQKAAGVVLDILAQTQDPDVKIEGLIAIGTMKDGRASYLIEQLAGDPNEAVAFAAAEVLRKLAKLPPGEDTAGGAGRSFPAAISESKIRGASSTATQQGKSAGSRLSARGAEKSGTDEAPEQGRMQVNDTDRSISASSPQDASPQKSAALPPTPPSISEPNAPVVPVAKKPSASSDPIKVPVPTAPPSPDTRKKTVKPRRPATIDASVPNSPESGKTGQENNESDWGEDSW